MPKAPNISQPVADHRGLVAAVLTFAAGMVDAFGYMALSGVFTSNMSGNSVLIGVHAMQGATGTAWLHGYTIAMFVLGLLAGGAAVEMARRRRVRRLLGVVMGIEALMLAGLLLVLGVLEDGGLALPIMLAAAAMGLQNTVLRMAGILSAFTTHVSGTITNFAEHAVGWAFADGNEDRRRARRGARIAAVLWCSFVAGAAVAVVLRQDYGPGALVPALVIICAVGLFDLWRPLTPLRD